MLLDAASWCSLLLGAVRSWLGLFSAVSGSMMMYRINQCCVVVLGAVRCCSELRAGQLCEMLLSFHQCC